MTTLLDRLGLVLQFIGYALVMLGVKLRGYDGSEIVEEDDYGDLSDEALTARARALHHYVRTGVWPEDDHK